MQGEDPVTEAVMGLHLVDQMLRVVVGKPLDLPQDMVDDWIGFNLSHGFT